MNTGRAGWADRRLDFRDPGAWVLAVWISESSDVEFGRCLWFVGNATGTEVWWRCSQN